MKFYMIKTSSSAQRDYCFLGGPPEGTNAFTHRMARGHPMGKDFPEGAKAKMSDRYGGMKLGSFISNTEMFLVVSAEIRTILEAAVAAPVEYLRFTLLNHKGRVASEDYTIVNPLGTKDVLDLAKSEIVRASTGGIIDVERFVLDPRKLADAPALLRPVEAPQKYIMNETLVSSIRNAGATNFEAKELEQSA